MFQKVLRQLFVLSSGLEEKQIKGALYVPFIPRVPYIFFIEPVKIYYEKFKYVFWPPQSS